MSQEADQILDSLLDGESTSHLVDPSLEEHIVIGEDRFITVPQMLKRIAVQYDHNIETVTFDCPRYWDGLDMSNMKVYINYLNANSNRGMYNADDITIDEEDDTIMHFTWTISREVTMYKGTISFLVCIRNVDEDGFENNHWNSELNRDMTVSEGLECDESIIQSYPDIITQLLMRMDRIGVSLTFEDDGNGNVAISGVNNLNNFCEKYDEKAVYYTGDYCMYLGVLYRCVYPVTEPEAFDFNKWVDTCLTDEMIQCFQSVDDGKTKIAAAITDMDVPTAATATFDTMATNIRSIIMCPPGSTATEEYVLEGKKFITSDKQVRTGTMPDHSVGLGIPHPILQPGEVYNIPEGYHDGKVSVTAGGIDGATPGTATASDILQDRTAWVNGVQVTGTMVDRRSTQFDMLLAGDSIELEPGYYDSTVRIHAAALHMQTLADATESDIRKGKTAWVKGAKLTGTLEANEEVLFDGMETTIRYVNNDEPNHNHNTSISYTAQSTGKIKIQVRACMAVTSSDSGTEHTVNVTITKNSTPIESSSTPITRYAGGVAMSSETFKRYEAVVSVAAGETINVNYSYLYNSVNRAAYIPISSLTILQTDDGTGEGGIVIQ